MENYTEIHTLIEFKNSIQKSIDDCAQIANIPFQGVVAIGNLPLTGIENNFTEIINCIGKEKFDSLVSDFAISVHSALEEVRMQNEKELSEYQIIKK